MATHLEKGKHYLGYGGQGLIMSKIQFITLIKDIKYTYIKYIQFSVIHPRNSPSMPFSPE